MHESMLDRTDRAINSVEIKEETPDSSFGFPVTDEESRRFFRLCSAVRQCGDAAKANQQFIHRSLKADGTILTETDLAVSAALTEKIAELYTGCNIITEESVSENFDPDAPFTFVLDPIDGTDSYSQGLPSWCTGLGILDRDRKPCGAVVYAPRFGRGTEGFLIYSLPGSSEVYMNGALHTAPEHYSAPRQLALGSDVLKYLDFSAYSGKIRSYGSSILHLLSPCIFSNIDACVDPWCYAWDIASAHALLLKLGLEAEYLDGSEIRYTDALLIERKQIENHIYAGSRSCIEYMKRTFKVKS